ncbi:9918_t:CDS:10 [Dentiscutata erythropus]|uniref:Vacuolar protein-sorting-associated protein 36 n=1 Tax=Dentiscutata erythropus TaxID=1348616 RepID=A0A9N9CFQ4_9GLOM|nr:9918_t:CDS:10 [Dentiscutata erythropus]
MNRFTRAELNSTFRPVLLYNETVLATQDNVGLYDGNEKAADYMNGTAYLTSHRIIYVDSQNPVTNSIAVEIKFIKGRDFYVRIWQAIGFVRSSPKITLRFSDTTSPYSHSDNQLYHSSPFSSVTNLQNTLPPTSSSWICPICSFINRDLQDIKCRLCGVKRIASSASSTLNVRSDFEDSVDQLQRSPSPNIPTDDIGIACKVCTFLNHPSMIKCEMCEADLRTFDVSNLDFENDLEASKNFKSAKDNDFVRLAFRDGGSNAFYEKLKSAMAAKEWEKAQETSMGIIRNAEQSQKEQKETLNQAFKDLDGLMAKTSEMVKLAESIRNKLSKELDSETSTDETSDFRTYLIELGIPNPVTKDSAGSTYHKELARQLAEFLDNLLEKENGMMSLTDIYCLFNRARGVALISPEDLYKACSQFEHLNLPMRLRKFSSGLMVVDDEQIAQRILQHIKTKGPLTAIELASLDKMSVVLINEQLQMVEEKGLICRDESVEGVRFYDNLIINFRWEK